MLEERTKIPVCGVMPYIYADIDDEDSLSERFERKEKAALLDIAVIRLPRISNFTDLRYWNAGKKFRFGMCQRQEISGIQIW